MRDIEYTSYQNWIGKTIVRILTDMNSRIVDAAGIEMQYQNQLVFVFDDGSAAHFYHSQDCCECVQIEDITGDLTDLLDSPLVLAEEASHGEDPKEGDDYTGESVTWTFYRFATAKGDVVIRWHGESNGYYSESVECDFYKPGKKVQKFLNQADSVLVAQALLTDQSGWAECKAPWLRLKYLPHDLIDSGLTFEHGDGRSYDINFVKKDLAEIEDLERRELSLNSANAALSEYGFGISKDLKWLYNTKMEKESIGLDLESVPYQKTMPAIINREVRWVNDNDPCYTFGLTDVGVPEIYIGSKLYAAYLEDCLKYVIANGLPENNVIVSPEGRRTKLVRLEWAQVQYRRDRYPYLHMAYGDKYDLLLAVPEDSCGFLVGQDGYGSDGRRDAGLLAFFGGIPPKV